MKRRHLISAIGRRALLLGKPWVHERDGKHEIWRCGRTRVVIPRHREVSEWTALEIMRDLQEELGEKWWRK